MTIDKAKEIMGSQFIGIDELRICAPALNFDIPDVDALPPIPYDAQTLTRCRENYYLVLALETFNGGTPVTCRSFKAIFGFDPQQSEPCFYNQDWYDHEEFIDRPLESGWFLIRKNVYEDSRAVQPTELIKSTNFPPAVKCVYAFFVLWLAKGEKIWYHDFIWCSDLDHNGDRIYVGKYHDIDGINKNGFSIHRHLALRPCYASIDTL